MNNLRNRWHLSNNRYKFSEKLNSLYEESNFFCFYLFCSKEKSVRIFYGVFRLLLNVELCGFREVCCWFIFWFITKNSNFILTSKTGILFALRQILKLYFIVFLHKVYWYMHIFNASFLKYRPKLQMFK